MHASLDLRRRVAELQAARQQHDAHAVASLVQNDATNSTPQSVTWSRISGELHRRCVNGVNAFFDSLTWAALALNASQVPENFYHMVADTALAASSVVDQGVSRVHAFAGSVEQGAQDAAVAMAGTGTYHQTHHQQQQESDSVMSEACAVVNNDEDGYAAYQAAEAAAQHVRAYQEANETNE